MKKRLKLIAVLVVICAVLFSFAACGGNLADNTNKIFASGTYQMTITMTSEGQTIDMTIAVKDKQTAIKMTSKGEELRIVLKDNKYYMINDAEKSMLVMSAETSGEETPDYSEIFSESRTYTNKTDVTIDGKKLTCEEYKIADGSIKYYFDGKTLVRIDTTAGSVTETMNIKELKGTVDAALFNIPTDYQQMSF
ncbi:MAG: hypothetical protein GYA50_00035 [Eubacteriaceae bacterium]|nr:hypothetical protein [Eubacteriaceae bacterium]